MEAVSAASSADRRESWEAAKAEGSSGVGGGILVGDVHVYTSMDEGEAMYELVTPWGREPSRLLLVLDEGLGYEGRR